MFNFRTLNTVRLNQSEKVFVDEDASTVTLETPAIAVATDFKIKRPALLEGDVSIDQALAIMRKSHVRSVLVIDGNEHFLGLLTLADLESRKVLSTAEAMNLKRADLTAADLMTPKQKLFGMPYVEIVRARIGDLLKTLNSLGTQHVLLTDDEQHIRGIISATEVARMLHVDIDITAKATSFAQIYDVVFRHAEV